MRVAFQPLRAADQTARRGGFLRWRWITWLWALCGVSWIAYLGVWNATVGHKTEIASSVSSAFLVLFVGLALAWWATLPRSSARAARATAHGYAGAAAEHPNYGRALDDDVTWDQLHSYYGHLIDAHRREIASKLNQKPWLLYLETTCPSCHAAAFRECHAPSAAPDAVHTTRPGAIYAPARVRPRTSPSRRRPPPPPRRDR